MMVRKRGNRLDKILHQKYPYWLVVIGFFMGFVASWALILGLKSGGTSTSFSPSSATRVGMFSASGFANAVDKVYVINRDACTARWETSKKFAEAIGVELTRFKAYEPTKEELLNPPDGISVRGLKHDYLTTGMLGVYVSHRRIWRLVVENNFEKVMVLEDDVFPTNQTWLHLPGLLQHADEAQKFHNKSWHYMFLRRNALGNVKMEKTWSLSPLGHPVTIATPSWGTAAYIISLAGARYLWSASREGQYPLDVQIAEIQKKNKDEFITLSACWNDQFQPTCPETVFKFEGKDQGDCKSSGNDLR
mmetsp:Transcript_39296/g.155889  ORF Transcript_39296/g.155889 Transcript_39296/m.155889 type:complete len:305 (-) Transcript_39296:358-1272(-)